MHLNHTPKHVIGMTAVFIGLAALTLFYAKNAQSLSSDFSIGSGNPSGYGFAAVSNALSLFDSTYDLQLGVPYFKQQYANSCEAASLRMVLAYYGTTADDMEVVKKIGYAPRVRDMAKNEWDDPQEQFVGFVDIAGAGYGVYGIPVASAAQAFGRTTEYRTVITPQFLAKEITDGHPVIIWGSTSIRDNAYTWNLPSGGQAKAFRGEHARVVVGVRGSAQDPIGFYVHDPINGKSFEFWTTSKIMEQLYGVVGVTNQAVVVR